MKENAKKRNRKILLIGLALVIAAAAGAIVGAYSLGDNQKKLYQQLGRIETQEGAMTADTGDHIAYRGKHIEITQEDLDRYVKRAQLLRGEEDVFDEALRNIAVREIYCYRGLEAGIPNDDAAFEAWLKKYRSGIEDASNYEDFVAFVQGAGMTTEEYWQWAETSPSFRQEYYANLFLEQLEEKFREENHYEQADENFQTKWSEYIKAYKDRAVEEEHLVKAGAQGEKE